MFLTITMTTANPLFNLLGVPRQIVVYDGITELQVQTLRTCVSYNKNLGVMLKIINNGVLIFNTTAIIGLSKVFYLPCTIDFLCHGIIKITVEQKNIFFGITVFS